MAAKLSMASLTRAWMLLMKGLQETLSAPSPLRAAEMALIRLCYAADLPSPSDAIKALQNGAAPALAAGVSAPAPRGGGGGGAAARLATQPVVATASQPAAATPNPKSFTEIVAL
jgi:DNA polymerase-3 subunit gamma/tau